MTLLVANWKMNLLTREAGELATKLVGASSALQHTDVWVAPATLSIPTVSEHLRGSKVRLGSQNLCWEKSGAFTGEISPNMLQEFGGSFAILGHSERRHVFGETNEVVLKRLVGALDNQITPILCVGETLAEREEGKTEDMLRTQLFGLRTIPEHQLKSLVIAYEPVWAIGTGKVASTEQIDETHSFIRELLQRSDIPILYGGSVTPDNTSAILQIKSVSGCLIGGASLIFDKFNSIITTSEHLVSETLRTPK